MADANPAMAENESITSTQPDSRKKEEEEEPKTRLPDEKEKIKTEHEDDKKVLNDPHVKTEKQLKDDPDYKSSLAEVDDVISQDLNELIDTIDDRLTLKQEHEAKQKASENDSKRSKDIVSSMRKNLDLLLHNFQLDMKNFKQEKTTGRGFFKCGKNCLLCKDQVQKDAPFTYTFSEDAKSFTSTQTKIEYDVDGSYDCQTSDIVYLLTCTKEGCGAQYVGHTERTLETAVGDYTAPKANKLKVQKHFKENGCGRCHLRCLVITQERNKEKRKQKKKDWVKILQTKGGNARQLNERS